jgi:hypothetical protein
MLGAVILILVISGMIVVNTIKKDPQKAYEVITALPVKIANIIAPPSIENKSKEEARKIVKELLKECAEAGEKMQLTRMMSIFERILKMGNLIVPVLIEIISDEKEEKEVRITALHVLGGVGEFKKRRWERCMSMNGRRN